MNTWPLVVGIAVIYALLITSLILSWRARRRENR